MEGGSAGRAAAKLSARLDSRMRRAIKGAPPAMSKPIAEFSRAGAPLRAGAELPQFLQADLHRQPAVRRCDALRGAARIDARREIIQLVLIP